VSIRPPSAPQLEPGDRLDRYELLCPVAQGGMAIIWVARLQGKHGFEKLFAIKTIRPEYANERSFQRMFLDEARIAARIDHPNVTRIVELGEERGVLYLAMEWVDGDALSKLIRTCDDRGTPFPRGVAARIIADALSGLHAAHELRDAEGVLLGVVHRDVSPQNILVTATGNTKLIDFGIAKARDRLSAETSTGMVKGKFSYMAPEQASGKVLVDRRADIFAAGAVLFHMLAAAPPVRGDNQLQILNALLFDEFPPLPDDVPKPIADVVVRAISRDMSTRYATAEEMQRALEGALVASGMPTAVSDVADFMRTLTADRIAARRNAIDVALRTISERHRMTEAIATIFPSVGGSAHATPGDPTDIDVAIGTTNISNPEVTNVPTEAAISSDTPPASLQKRGRGRLVVACSAAAIVAATVGVGFVAANRAETAHTNAASASAAPSTIEEPPPPVVALPPPPPTSEPVPSASPSASPPKRVVVAPAPTPRAPPPPPPPSSTTIGSKRNGALGF
jgi:serine/threonine-protein kinase